MDDRVRIERAQRGDSQALAQLLREHYAFLLNYMTKITMQPALAEDLTQETMMRAIEKIRLYNFSSKFSSWLITIGTNLYMDQLRKKKREREWQDREQAMRLIKWRARQSGESWSDLLDALGRMADDVRIPIVLKHYYGYAYDEIADMLGIAAGTVKSRIHNGIKQLRKELEPDESR
ncbi:RNA polymerase sigma factor SigY [Paenibacillus flagellatus]|uniref:RNA polymerase sigma factor n=1 Tax=Paenibacillus flagellatus TaxID=2211139 RepID=A0A2V5K1K7_9BACL|nr:RNA polymerase sigma factor SigY [Paenibacillus flagellatus]PYI51624.1 RNA polymerase sigma factor SigY [Paenibacillus flagellatus]